MALQNLPGEAVAEAAIAAALLLEHAPAGVSMLLRPGALRSLVAAVLKEAAGPLPENATSARTLASDWPLGVVDGLR